jgi:phospholipid-transporting ATPase
MQKAPVQLIDKMEEQHGSIQRMAVHFGPQKDTENKRKVKNSVRTSKYTFISWAPLSLLYQFTRAANIYFLWISILTCLSFSPKTPASMIGTFAGVLIFTMLKELFEDYYRMKSDRQINSHKTHVFNYESETFEETTWKHVKQGDIIKVLKDEDFPSDILFLHSKTDVIFVDTMSLDGETNLKPKVLGSRAMVDTVSTSKPDSEIEQNELPELDLTKIKDLSGRIECELPNENLEHWDANLNIGSGTDKPVNLKISNMLLRGCFLRNTAYVIGIVIYMGKETKIMKNAKKPPRKVSNLMKMMNYMLYTVFAFQIAIISVFATFSVIWIGERGENYPYLDMDKGDAGVGKWFIQLLTYWVAYSHMIPISLYVIIEVLKLVQSNLVKWDTEMYDDETKQFAECRNSDLVEELGQIDFIFSDKTGTLTCNKMEFKRCSVDGKVYSTDDQPDKPPPSCNVNQSNEALVNNDCSPYDIVNMTSNESRQRENTSLLQTRRNSPAMTEFFKFMTLCHAVMVDRNPETNEIMYQSSSPDELALVSI